MWCWVGRLRAAVYGSTKGRQRQENGGLPSREQDLRHHLQQHSGGKRLGKQRDFQKIGGFLCGCIRIRRDQNDFCYWMLFFHYPGDFRAKHVRHVHIEQKKVVGTCDRPRETGAARLSSSPPYLPRVRRSFPIVGTRARHHRQSVHASLLPPCFYQHEQCRRKTCPTSITEQLWTRSRVPVLAGKR